jgi:hypothetical protein
MDNDKQAVDAWVAAKAGSQATVKVYTREAMRLLLRLRYERGGATLRHLSLLDCRDYMAFCSTCLHIGFLALVHNQARLVGRLFVARWRPIMRDVMAELKALRLHGMAGAWGELSQQGWQLDLLRAFITTIRRSINKTNSTLIHSRLHKYRLPPLAQISSARWLKFQLARIATRSTVRHDLVLKSF